MFKVKDSRPRCALFRLFKRMGIQHRRTASVSTSVTDVDDPEPLSPSSTIAEKADQALVSILKALFLSGSKLKVMIQDSKVPFARHDGSCFCGGPWPYPTEEPASINSPTRTPTCPDSDDVQLSTLDGVMTTISATIDRLNPQLRDLSLEIWSKWAYWTARVVLNPFDLDRTS